MAFRTARTQMYPPPPTFTEEDVSDQTGKVFMVTGGNAGIGFELCKMLYGTGATIYMTSRSESRAKQAIAEIEGSEISGLKKLGNLRYIQLDLNDLASVKTAAEAFNNMESRLDLLVHNAGSAPQNLPKFAKTAQGLEAMVGMHCVAPFVLTHYLLPKLRYAIADSSPGSVRVLWTSSISAEFDTPENGIDFSNLATGTENGRQNYAVSKIGNWALAKETARRYGDKGLVSIALNPGNVRSRMYQGLPAVTSFLFDRFLLKDTKFGAYTELFAAFSAEVGERKWNGGYIVPFGRTREDGDWHRKDIVNAFKAENEGGFGYALKFWEWCELQGKGYM